MFFLVYGITQSRSNFELPDVGLHWLSEDTISNSDYGDHCSFPGPLDEGRVGGWLHVLRGAMTAPQFKESYPIKLDLECTMGVNY